ncbi:hypothetical protein BC792_12426 [Sphingobacterium allocomposti]|uniref:WG repeat protein n=1 Tax=Sphingobacterium allocomposti TaxID=415956 RepID=A0A5S5D3A9_9SPHI|nr:hypothetical protein [Sphingobacterium composti Yoo et al. 2007 non Ten et al. 2007]TYP90245.1 hypothetical protein BC792_12426 [Sphingobacterium composti Yoo et al. 2007 non Ten et al. 2007]
MKRYRSYSIFTMFLRNFVFLSIFIQLLVGCKKNGTALSGPSAGGYSILVNNGNILVSGFKSEHSHISTRYWIDGEKADQQEFTERIENQSIYRQAVDDQWRQVCMYKDRDGIIQSYRFDQGSGAEAGKIHYYKDSAVIRMDNDSIGSLSAVAFTDDSPLFAGYLGTYGQVAVGGSVMYPRIAFVWDGQSPITQLSMLPDSAAFKGVSAVYRAGPDEFYVGGLYGRPMYWKNTDPVVLDERYGEVWQITKVGPDVYAAGLINKRGSNSTGHTACYWKNGELHELEDDAQAFGICINGDDVYVSGAVGSVPAQYRPCYWKNGIRTDLPI